MSQPQNLTNLTIPVVIFQRQLDTKNVGHSNTFISLTRTRILRDIINTLLLTEYRQNFRSPINFSYIQRGISIINSSVVVVLMTRISMVISFTIISKLYRTLQLEVMNLSYVCKVNVCRGDIKLAGTVSPHIHVSERKSNNLKCKNISLAHCANLSKNFPVYRLSILELVLCKACSKRLKLVMMYGKCSPQSMLVT